MPSNKTKMRPVVAQGHKCVNVNATGYRFDPRKWNNYLNLYFHFFALVSTRWVPPLNTHSISPMNLAESDKWSVLTLGFFTYNVMCGIQREAWFFLKQKWSEWQRQCKHGTKQATGSHRIYHAHNITHWNCVNMRTIIIWIIILQHMHMLDLVKFNAYKIIIILYIHKSINSNKKKYFLYVFLFVFNCN